MKPVLLAILFFLCLSFSFGQQKYNISGTVSDSVSGSGLPFVNVYFQGSTIGTQTDENGNFKIINIKSGKYKLVASMVSFKPNVMVLSVDKDINDLKIKLEEDQTALKELKVVGKRDRDWENNFKDFSLEFLGNNFKKKEVFIKNKEVVNFEKVSDSYKATAFEPLVIENYKLGYRVHFILEYFEKDINKVIINGIPRFENLTPKDEKQEQLWDKNRRSAYYGSLKHLFKAILYRQLKEQSFQCQYMETDIDNMVFYEVAAYGNSPQLKFVDSNLVFKTNIENIFLVNFKHRVMVKYWNGNKWLERSILKQKVPIEVDEIGNVFDPMSIEISGSLAEKRMANILPFDFETTDFNTSQLVDFQMNLPAPIEEPFKEPREKIEISGNKPYYLAGEKLDVECKNFELQSGLTSKFSGVLYVDLIDVNSGILLQHFKLKIKDGRANLKYRLPFSSVTSNYQIRAYTKWMLNYSKESFATAEFPVFGQNYKAEMPNALDSHIDSIAVHAEANAPLVVGLKSRIVVESFDNFGRKIPVFYKIISPKGKEVLESFIDSTGLSFVEFVPHENGDYKILSEKREFKMPKIESSGIVLASEYISFNERLRVHIQNKRPDLDSLNLVILKAGQVVYYNRISNRLSSYLINIDLPTQSSSLNLFLLDKKYNILAEKCQVVDTLGNAFFEETIRSFTKPLSKSFEFKRRYDYERDMSLSGIVAKPNGSEFTKPIEIKFVLSDLEQDSIKSKPQIFIVNTADKFKIEGLDFFGKNRLAYTCSKCEVKFDTTFTLPPVMTVNKPINWYLVLNQSEAIKSRKENAEKSFLEENRNNVVKLNEVVVKSEKALDPMDKFSQVTPAFVLKSSMIQTFQFSEDAVRYLMKNSCQGYFPVDIKVIVNNVVTPLNMISDILPQSIDKMEVYKGPDAAIYNCGCAINLRLKSSINYIKEMNFILLDGYYRSED